MQEITWQLKGWLFNGYLTSAYYTLIKKLKFYTKLDNYNLTFRVITSVELGRCYVHKY